VCAAIKSIVTKAKAQNAAATYCSSLLKIPAAGTATVSSTSTMSVTCLDVVIGISADDPIEQKLRRLLPLGPQQLMA
jgi:hypothetical protein